MSENTLGTLQDFRSLLMMSFLEDTSPSFLSNVLEKEGLVVTWVPSWLPLNCSTGNYQKQRHRDSFLPPSTGTMRIAASPFSFLLQGRLSISISPSSEAMPFRCVSAADRRPPFRLLLLHSYFCVIWLYSSFLICFYFCECGMYCFLDYLELCVGRRFNLVYIFSSGEYLHFNLPFMFHLFFFV